MSLYAVSNVGDAIEATRRFLVPVSLSRWAKLAVVVFFVGGFGVTVPTSPWTVQPPPRGFEATGDPVDLQSLVEGLPKPFPQDLAVLAGAVLVATAVFWVGFRFVAAVMEFVFVAALREEAVRIRTGFADHWRRGARLFGFTVGVAVVGLAVVAPVGYYVATAVVDAPPTAWGAAELFRFVALVGPVAAVVYALVSLVNGFTAAFVVPVMVADDRTVLGGWRRFWPTLRDQATQYGAYVVLAVLLAIAVGILTATATAVGAAVLAVPFVVVAGLSLSLLGFTLSWPVVVTLSVLGLVYVALVLTLLAFVQVPLRTFTRYYTLFILGDTNPQFDLVAEARAAVRG